MSRVEVLVIGGGVTGAGVARDLALRGVEVALVEKSDFSAGATGRSHGMLHSGGRYAVKDPDSASECARESSVLKRIAAFCIEETGGMFVGTEGDDPDFTDVFLHGCRMTGVKARELTIREATSREPLLSEKIHAAIEVPDASVDPFALTIGNIDDARDSGAEVLNYKKVRGFRREGAEIIEVLIENLRNGAVEAIAPEIIVNATGAWAGEVAALAGLHVDVALDKGTLVVLDGRLVNGLVNRLRRPADGDIIVPSHSASIVGTTSVRVGIPEDPRGSRAEVESLIEEASRMVPAVREARAVRAYAGVRPLPGCGKEAREVTRTFKVIDHEPEGAGNFVSVVGGKLTTYRLMAERVSDLVSEKLGASGVCRTAIEPIGPPEGGVSIEGVHAVSASRIERKYGRQRGAVVLACTSTIRGRELLCSCEEVLRGEAEHFCRAGDVRELSDLTRRTRVGMGFCQSGLCAFGLLSVMIDHSEREPLELLGEYLRERWKGIEPVLKGEQLRQEVFKHCLLAGVYHLDALLGGGDGSKGC